MLLGIGTALQTSAQPVYADDTPSNMGDIAGHYANAGMQWAITDPSDGSYKAHAITPWQKTYSIWNFFGPGKNSILSAESASQKGGSYEALKANVPSQVSKNVENAARYSYAMSQTGLDHPTNGGTDIWHKIGRIFLGIVSVLMMYISYIGSNIIHILFKLFKWTNVFYALRWLTTTDKLDKSVFSSVIVAIRPIYKTLSSISVGILLLTLVGGIFISFMGFRQQGHQEGLGANIAMKVMRKIFQILSIFAAPICFGIISANLTAFLDDSMDVTSNITLNEIYGNYVNFSGWANHSRLALPNKANMSGPLNTSDQLNASGNNAFSEDYLVAINAYGAGMSVPAKLLKTHKTTLGDVNSTANFLWRYVNASGMSGEDWNGTFQARLRKRIRGIKGDTIKEQGSGAKAQNPSISKKDALKNPYQAISSDIFGDYGNSDYAHAMNCMFFSDGSLDSYTAKNGQTYYMSNAPNKAESGDVAAIGDSSEAGLSSIGLYNYLNVDGSSGSQLKYTEPSGFHLGSGGFIQHANEGFIGRGLMAVGSFAKMIAIIATAGLVVGFVGMIVVQGMLRNIPYILVYAVKIATGNLTAVLSVFRELVDTYARVFIGCAIIYIFQGMIPLLCNKIETFLLNGLNGASIYIGNVNLLPFANITSNGVGVVRILLAICIFFIMQMIIRSYRDIIKWVDNLINTFMEHLKKTNLGRNVLPNTPNPSMAGMNNASNTNANNSSQMNDDNLNNNSNGGPYNDDTPDSADTLRDRQRDPEQNYGQKTNSKGFAKQSALLGLDALDAMDGTAGGQALKKGAAALGGALGGSKLGEALHMKGRGEGMQAIDKAEQRLRQSMAMAADPVHANNTAKAGMSGAERKASDAQEKHAQQMASPAALAQAKKDQQAAKQAKQDIVDQFKPGVDESGKPISELKDASAINGVVDAMKSQDALSPKAKEAAQKMQDLANSEYEGAQKRTDRLKDAVDKAKEAYDKDPSPENKAALDEATDNLHKAQVISDPGKRAMFEHANKRAVTPSGIGLKAATNGQMSQARRRQFTAMTGMDASTSVAATPEQLAKAQMAATGAQKILAQHNISPSMRARAAQDLQEANVVLQTKRQFGSYATPQATADLKAASKDVLQQAKRYQQVDRATIATHVVATDNTPRMSPAEMAYAKKVDNARAVIQTGQIMSHGQQRVASTQELATAQQTLASDPAKQVSRIQANMMTTTSTIMEQARNYGAKTVANAPASVGTTEVMHLRQQAEVEYLHRPEVQQQLRSSGLVNTRSPQALQKQIVRIQKMDQTMRDGLSASLEPIRAQIQQMPDSPSPIAIKQASEQQFGKLYASSRLVDTAHYQRTTNQQVERATQQLLSAYHSNNPDRIKIARAKAASIGMANPIINSQKRLHETEHIMREQRNNVISNATSLNGSTSDVMSDIASHMGEYGEADTAVN